MKVSIVILSLLLSCALSAQKRSAIKLFEEAQQSRQISNAEQLYLEAINRDEDYTGAYIALSQLYTLQERDLESTQILQQAISKACQPQEQLYALLAKSAYLSGQYQLADQSLDKAQLPTEQASYWQERIAFALDAITHPTDFSPQNAGNNINTKYDDYWPSISIDEKQIVSTVLISEKDNDAFSSQEDLYYSIKTNDVWSKSKAISPRINSPKNEGAQCLSADGKLMFFTACNRSSGIGLCDIFYSTNINGQWTVPQALPEPINSPYWDAHPSLSSDNRFLYFSSNRKGGLGGRDLYRARIKISAIGIDILYINHLGNEINTPQDEVSPFIHPDNSTLYFSSNGHIGMGRMDIYMAQLRGTDFIVPVRNLGYPINAHKDDIGFVVSASGRTAYFSSERKGSQKKDIFSFHLSEEIRPQSITYLSSHILDLENSEELNAHITIRDLHTSKIVYAQSNISRILTPLVSGKDYAINVKKEGYLFYSAQFNAKTESSNAFEKDIYLTSIKENESIILANVLFAHNSANLDTSYTLELEETMEFIRNNADLYFCIEGHTDQSGSDHYNLTLSEQRAKTIYQYFINAGIAKQRLSYKGFGSQQPISSINSVNRRTELRIIPRPKQKQ